jgi:hypothetical protein
MRNKLSTETIVDDLISSGATFKAKLENVCKKKRSDKVQIKFHGYAVSTTIEEVKSIRKSENKLSRFFVNKIMNDPLRDHKGTKANKALAQFYWEKANVAKTIGTHKKYRILYNALIGKVEKWQKPSDEAWDFHHKDRNRQNNTWENIQPMKTAAHRNLHQKEKAEKLIEENLTSYCLVQLPVFDLMRLDAQKSRYRDPAKMLDYEIVEEPFI